MGMFGDLLTKSFRVGWRERGCCSLICPQVFGVVIMAYFSAGVIMISQIPATPGGDLKDPGTGSVELTEDEKKYQYF